MLESHLEKLRAFHIAAQEKSINKASLRLGVTQPAITKSIRLLETQMEVPLFVRHRRGVELTKAGVLLQEFCEKLFLNIKNIEKQIKSDSELSGVVRIGTYETLGELFWPKMLKMLHLKYPDLVVELTTLDAGSFLKKLEVGMVDLIVDAEPETEDPLFSKVLYTDYFGVFCSKKSRFLDWKKNIPISYVKRAHDRYRLSIEDHLRKNALSVDLLYDVESFTMVRSFLLEDVCIGVLPLTMAAKYLKNGAIQPYKGLGKFGEHRICATCLQSSKNEPKIVSLFSILRQSS